MTKGNSLSAVLCFCGFRADCLQSKVTSDKELLEEFVSKQFYSPQSVCGLCILFWASLWQVGFWQAVGLVGRWFSLYRFDLLCKFGVGPGCDGGGLLPESFSPCVFSIFSWS